MPTYEYLCKACGQQHEIFQKITDEPVKECPACHKPALTKQISAANFQLKGTGWYVTDIRDKDKKKPAEQTETKSADNASSGKTETKTVEKKSDDSSTKSGGDST